MHKLLYTLVIPIIVGVIGALILINLFPGLLQPTITLNEVADQPNKSTGVVISYASAVDKAAPAVVSIYTSTFGNQTPTTSEHLEQSLGSGVIFSPNGYLLTNYHVIANATEIIVALRDGRKSKPTIIGVDPDTDLAVLKIDLPNLPTIALAESDKVRVGDVALAIGNPFIGSPIVTANSGQTVTMGIISATGRHQLGLNTYEDFIQTDAAINHGNSGGALVNAYGNLIGINAAVKGDSQGIGFAIPAKLASSVLQEIIIHGEVIRGWLGVTVESISKGQLIKKDNRIVQVNQNGLVIAEMDPKGPAISAGLRLGDLVLAIDDQSAEDGYAILNWIAQSKPGSKSIVTVWRNGETLQIEVPIAKKPTVVN